MARTAGREFRAGEGRTRLGLAASPAAILPMDGSRKEMKRGTVAAIKKQLSLE